MFRIWVQKAKIPKTVTTIPELMLIFEVILLQIRMENGGKVQTFTISIGSRIAGSGFGLEVGRIDLYCGVNWRRSGRQAEAIEKFEDSFTPEKDPEQEISSIKVFGSAGCPD